MAANDTFSTLFNMAKKSAASAGIDLDAVANKAVHAGAVLAEKAVEVRDAANVAKEEIDKKLHEMDEILNQAITDYNDAYTQMNDKGVQLFVARSRAVDSIDMVETLVNSIRNKPAEFEAAFAEIVTYRQQFTDSCTFADKELQAARAAAGGAGAGLAAGASVAFMAPTAAMWVATTFGTASTGTAISALSGAAASNAALAWLGGGALTAGGGGMAAGNALLAMAGPIGWTIAGATLLTSIVLFAKQRTKLNQEKQEEITAVKNNTETVLELSGQIGALLDTTLSTKEGVDDNVKALLCCYGGTYTGFTVEQKHMLGSMVNNTRSLAKLLSKTVEQYA